MTHSRACPKCGKIIPWSKGKKKRVVSPWGNYVDSYEMHLICPEHGEFRNPAEGKALNKINSLEDGE